MEPEFQPYVGPRSFEQKDQAIFFGRDNEAKDILSLVIAHAVVLVYAQSGAGKTSLLNARLIPLLEKEGFEVLPIARVRGVIPPKIKTEKIENMYIFNTLMNWAEGKYEVELANTSLTGFLKKREHKKDEDGLLLPRAVIFDQFEEIFSLYQDRWKDRKGFFEQVSAALEADPLLRVVFVMREDFIAQLDPYAYLLPERLRTRFHMERLRREGAMSAITGPLRDTGRSFAEGVAEKLVDDLLKIRIEAAPGEIKEITGEFIEAVQLQVVCQSLWRELPPDERQITLQHLQTYGNVEQALSRFYDDAVRAAADKAHIDEKRLRIWCEEVLITSMGTRGMMYRAPESTGGIPNAAIDVLESKHLIRAEWRAGARWYELTHDRFIKPIQDSNSRLGLEFLEGMWIIHPTESLVCARIINGKLYVPYCYGGDSHLSARFYNWKIIGDTLFSRFKWFDTATSGYAILKIIDEDTLSGGWYIGEAIPPLNFKGDFPTEGKHEIKLERIKDRKEFPEWAEYYFKKLIKGKIEF